MSNIALWMLVCVAALIWLAWILRRDRLSLGIPLAYVLTLFLIHLPGAFTRMATDQFDYNAEVIEIGIRYTAIGTFCFVAGVQLIHLIYKRQLAYRYVEHREFWYFCLIGGLILQFGLTFLADLPSARSAIDRGSNLWTLGALMGLRFALSQENVKALTTWVAASLIYPILILLLAGFMSYGSIALIIVMSALVVSARSRLKLIVTGCVIAYVGLSVFVNYFEHRTEFREVAWSQASKTERIEAALRIFSNFQWFDPTNVTQLEALDKRLNQNLYVGMAALRIEQEQVDYLYGRSIWEGFEALVPRALWPDKPVKGGSGRIVADMTGLNLNEETSWGVGNVMEFQINFGMVGVLVGFFLLGVAIGWLDFKAALADIRGDFDKLILYFLVGLALCQPGGSIVEMTGGAAAAGVAAFVWKWCWQLWLTGIRRHGQRRGLIRYP